MLLAFDKSSRYTDKDGKLHVSQSNISKSNISPYYGREIPKWETLGLDPNRIYQLLRPAEELAKSVDTFKMTPILAKHIAIDSTNIPDDLIIGTIGSNVEFIEPYLQADLCFWKNEYIVAIETGKVKELSPAYYYDAVMESGELEGVKFDGKMINIKANHLALVEVGRTGKDVMVADSKPFRMRYDVMKMSKLGVALIAALGLLSPKIAQDTALPELLGKSTRKSFNKKEVVSKLLAMDETVNPNMLDEVLDAILGVEDDPQPIEAAVDETPEGKIKALLSGKVDDETIRVICSMLAPMASDEDEEKMSKEEVKTAMDSMRKELLETQEAQREVRSVVGDISIAMDSAASVYEFALDQLKIDHEGIKDAKALKALFKVANSKKEIKQEIAKDSTIDLFKQFPQAARIRQA
jgi:hypothetical protein